MALVYVVVSGLVTTVAVFIFQIPTIGLDEIALGLDWLFTIFFPNYNMASCFINMYTNYENTQICQAGQSLCKVTRGPCCKGKHFIDC